MSQNLLWRLVRGFFLKTFFEPLQILTQKYLELHSSWGGRVADMVAQKMKFCVNDFFSKSDQIQILFSAVHEVYECMSGVYECRECISY